VDAFIGADARERSAALKSEVFADAGKAEEFAQRPANPEIFLDAYSLQAHRLIHLPKGGKAAGIFVIVGTAFYAIFTKIV
jgi:hypothetical protein